jgi:hypothetical protein
MTPDTMATTGLEDDRTRLYSPAKENGVSFVCRARKGREGCKVVSRLEGRRPIEFHTGTERARYSPKYSKVRENCKMERVTRGPAACARTDSSISIDGDSDGDGDAELRRVVMQYSVEQYALFGPFVCSLSSPERRDLLFLIVPLGEVHATCA